MRLVPKKNAPKIQFFKTRLNKWLENAEQIGTSTETVELMSELTQAARDAYTEQKIAMQTARTATIKLNIAMEKMGVTGSAIIGQIRAAAKMQGPSIYVLASIAKPKNATTIGEPGKPDNFKFTVDQVGILTLTWKCKNPRGSSGTMYQIWRSVDGGAKVLLGQVGKRRYVDTTIPPGTANIAYEIQAFRSTATGPMANYTISFGTTDGMRKMIAQTNPIGKAA